MSEGGGFDFRSRARALGRHPLRAPAIVQWAGADDRTQRDAAVQPPRIAAGGRTASQGRGGCQTLYDARALPADLSADDLCRPAFGTGLKRRSSGSPVANDPKRHLGNADYRIAKDFLPR